MRFLLAFILCTLVLSPLSADPIEIPKTRAEKPQLKSIYSATHDLAELMHGNSRAVVFIFTDVDCPVAQLYLPRLRALHEEYAKRGVEFYCIYPNTRVDVSRMAQHAHDQDIPFPVFLDINHRLADLLDAEVTPEVVVLDTDLENATRAPSTISSNGRDDSVKQVPTISKTPSKTYSLANRSQRPPCRPLVARLSVCQNLHPSKV